MEVLQALDDLSDVETGSGLLKPRVVLIHQVDVVPISNRKTGVQLANMYLFTYGIFIHTTMLLLLCSYFESLSAHIKRLF